MKKWAGNLLQKRGVTAFWGEKNGGGKCLPTENDLCHSLRELQKSPEGKKGSSELKKKKKKKKKKKRKTLLYVVKYQGGAEQLGKTEEG